MTTTIEAQTRGLEGHPSRRRSTWARRFSVVVHLIRMLQENGRWWLIPFVVVLLGALILLVGLQAIEYVAPFVYSVF